MPSFLDFQRYLNASGIFSHWHSQSQFNGFFFASNHLHPSEIQCFLFLLALNGVQSS